MKGNSTIRLAVMLAAVCLGAPWGIGQQRVQDGHAQDANPRAGSGGINITPTTPTINPNQIITGNVTGGREFHGFVPYTDPRELRIPTAERRMDDFIKNSNGVAAPYAPAPIPNQPQPFYGDSLATAPPAGFVKQPGTGAYVPAKPAPLIQPLQDTRIDLRPPNPQDQILGNTTMQGPDQGNMPTYITLSPLYGVKQWRIGDETANLADRLKIDPRALQQMQDDLDRAAKNETNTEPGQGEDPQNPKGLTPAKPLGQPMGPRNPAVGPAPMNESLTAGPMVNQVRPEGRVDIRSLPTPAQQSSQYAELRKKLEGYYQDRMAASDKIRADIEAQIKARQEDSSTTRPFGATSRPSGLEAFGVTDLARVSRDLVAEAAGTAPKSAPKRPAPVRIASLAAGVKAAGLKQVLTRAEEFMKQGKYTSALDQYDAAEQVAPNNPLIWLGRGNAELAAGFYAKAEMHLRQALLTDPTLLMGRYDLVAMLGQERVTYLVTDLKQLSAADQKAARPVLLLAYIYYNVNNPQQAADFLSIASERAGKDDLLIKTLREHWQLE